MIVLIVVYNIIAIMCIIYTIFRPMDVLSWWWTKSKSVFKKIYEMIKGFLD